MIYALSLYRICGSSMFITLNIFFIQPGQEQSNFSILLKDLETCNNDTRTCARKVNTSSSNHLKM